MIFLRGVKMQKKLVSVIIPTYNRGYILDSALTSLCNQTFQDFEVVVVDDGSTDDTESIVKSYDKLQIVYIKCEENRGGNHARNIGISRAEGKYFAFLDSDNEWLPDNLAIKVKLLQETEEQVGFVFGSFYVIREEKQEIFLPTEIETQEKLKRKMLTTNVVDTNTALVKRECFEKVGLFDEKLKRLQDWDMFGRILFDGNYEAVFCKEPLVVNKIQTDSISMNNTILFEAWSRMLSKRWKDYRKEYEADGIFDVYLFTLDGTERVPFYERIRMLLAFDIDKEDWDSFWNRKVKRIKQMEISDRNWSTCKRWILLEEKNRNVAEWFQKYNVSNIGIYGLGYLGKHLLHELERSDRHIVFIIDKNEKISHKDIPVFHSVNQLPEVEMIVVTAVTYYEEIERELKQATLAQIVSLDTILADLI